MNTEHFQKSTAYLDGALMSLPGDKVVIISYGSNQDRFYVTESGEVNRCGDQGPVNGKESDFELYRMSFLEALISSGSLIIRQIAVSQIEMPAHLGGIKVPVDFLRGAEIGPKGIRPLNSTVLKSLYANGVDGAVEFHNFPTKDSVKIALIKQVEKEQQVDMPKVANG